MRKLAAAAGAAVLMAGIGGASVARSAELLVGAFAHDVTFIGEAIGSGAPGREEGVDLHLGLRTEPIAYLFGGPQLHVFVSINSESTSNFVAAGVSWPIALTERLYVRPGLGLAYTDGEAGLPPVNAPGLTPAEIARRLELYNTRIDFGSQVLFQPELSLGYELTSRLAAELSWVHISNAQIFHQGKNQGLDAAGVRLIYSF
ncbi:MAG: acyloxyacyl hydrolase [Phenylobacterium sp.]|uniref:acyloxyacyl hydrolase n=1 Tax=Phenylobacterium sp. TaxID=1871053 RepID=UPI00271DEED9|nr:acyloxyacyl hydrolase [Phenylobacterium sp.]MDO8900702.1 acyloxyacyl hydrolase [Phenylobacterium sp.]MDP2215302.1 acyloxyacyl hydrolase [Phenylobacterium sp.]